MPFQRRHAFAGRHVPHLERVVADADTTRRPSGNTATLETYDEARSSQKYSGRRNARSPECPFSVATHDASPRPTLERLVARPDTTRRPSGNTATPDLRRSQIITKVQDDATHPIRVPFQRPQLGELRQVHAFGKRHEPRRATPSRPRSRPRSTARPSSVRLPTGWWRRPRRLGSHPPRARPADGVVW